MRIRGQILVVDDDDGICTLLARLLGQDHDVILVDNGAEALKLVEGGARFDVVLSDLDMPGVTGGMLLKQLRRVAPDQADRTIIVTANARSPLAADVGTQFVLEKPFGTGQLKKIVDDVISAARRGYFPERAVPYDQT